VSTMATASSFATLEPEPYVHVDMHGLVHMLYRCTYVLGGHLVVCAGCTSSREALSVYDALSKLPCPPDGAAASARGIICTPLSGVWRGQILHLDREMYDPVDDYGAITCNSRAYRL